MPHAAEALGSRSPITRGTEAQALAAARVLESVADDMRHVRHLVTLSLSDLASLQGLGLGALTRFLVEHLSVGVRTCINDVERASQAFARFARQSEHITQDATVCERECGNALETIRVAWQQALSAGHVLGAQALAVVPHHWASAPPVRPPAEWCAFPTPDLEYARISWESAATSWHGALERVTVLRGRWSDLCHERELAEGKLAAALDDSSLLGAFIAPGSRRSSRYLLTRSLTGLTVHTRHLDSHAQLSRLLSGELRPDEIARLWQASEFGKLTSAELRLLPPEVLFGFASLVGLPSRAHDVISRAALEIALQDPRAAYRVMGFAGSDMSFPEFVMRVSALAQALSDAEEVVQEQLGETPVQFVGFGNHDDALTAAIAVGNLDTASHVGVNVSGMFSTTSNMSDTFPGVVNLYEEAQRANAGHEYAVVHWVGYRSPGMLPGRGGVLGMRRAQSGGYELGAFIDGMAAARAVSGQGTAHTALFGHSYGSTTAIEAAKGMSHEVDHLVTYGSAGVALDDLRELRVRHVAATSAKGDQVAWAGIVGGSRVDPRAITHVQEFSAEAVDEYLRVTAHDMYVPEGESSLVNPTKTGYLSENTHALHEMGKVLAGVGVGASVGTGAGGTP